MPAIQNPSDFSTYWDNAKTVLATIPVDARMTLLPERCTENVNVYHVSLQHYKPGTRLYGILCIPKKEGKYPALLQVPGAGVRPYAGDIANAEKGIITFQIGIHGVPVNMDVSVYNNLATGALAGYWNYNLGFNDETCPPTSMYAAYNVITAPKELFIVPETGHWTFPEQGEKMNSWIVSKLNNE